MTADEMDIGFGDFECLDSTAQEDIANNELMQRYKHEIARQNAIAALLDVALDDPERTVRKAAMEATIGLKIDFNLVEENHVKH